MVKSTPKVRILEIALKINNSIVNYYTFQSFLIPESVAPFSGTRYHPAR